MNNLIWKLLKYALYLTMTNQFIHRTFEMQRKSQRSMRNGLIQLQ